MNEQTANHYISIFQPVIDDCKTQTDYAKAYQRISASVAGMTLGRGFNEDFDTYLEKHPVKKEFVMWWHSIKEDLHLKAYLKPLQPAQ